MAWHFIESESPYVSVADHVKLTIPDTDWCLSMWVRFAAQEGAGVQYVISWRRWGETPSFNRYMREPNASSPGKATLGMEDMDAVWLTHWSSATHGDANWQHWLVFRDKTNQKIHLYYDGVEDPVGGVAEVFTAETNASEPLLFGKQTDLGDYLDGDLAEVAFWRSKPNADEIAELAAGKSPAWFQQNLVWHIPCTDYTERIAGLAITSYRTTITPQPPKIYYPRPRMVEHRLADRKQAARRKRRRDFRRRKAAGCFGFAALRGKWYQAARGKYRVFNEAEYRFYRSNSGPPAESDTPFASNATLPYTPADTFADGTWYLSVSYFNGVMDSGFLPLGPAGETFLRLDLSGGEETGSPPAGPTDWRLEPVANGVVRILGFYWQTGDLRADQWAIAYTTNGGDPPADSPDVTQDMPEGNLGVLSYELPAQGHGTTVKVRLQTRRNDGTAESPDWIYSEGSTIKTVTADASGPAAPLAGHDWPGRVMTG